LPAVIVRHDIAVALGLEAVGEGTAVGVVVVDDEQRGGFAGHR